MSELIVLCDPNGTPIGVADKLEIHTDKTPLHLAFSCYVFNNARRLLVTKRAGSKKVWPGVWTNTVCGHPAPNETLTDAINRRLADELGMTATEITEIVSHYNYTTPLFKGIIENEFCPIFIARSQDQPRPNPNEVEDYKWLAWDDYLSELAADTGNTYSWWAKDQQQYISDKIQAFLAGDMLV